MVDYTDSENKHVAQVVETTFNLDMSWAGTLLDDRYLVLWAGGECPSSPSSSILHPRSSSPSSFIFRPSSFILHPSPFIFNLLTQIQEQIQGITTMGPSVFAISKQKNHVRNHQNEWLKKFGLLSSKKVATKE